MTNSRTKSPFFSVVKPLSVTRNSTTTLADDNDFIKILPIGKYTIYVTLFFSSGTTPLWKHKFLLTGGSGSGVRNTGVLTSTPIATISVTDTSNITTDGNVQTISLVIRLGVSSQTTFSYQWAQQVSNAGDTILNEGSSMVIYKS